MRNIYPKYKVEFKISKVGYKDAKTNFTICEGLIQEYSRLDGKEDKINPITPKMVIHGTFQALKEGDIFEGVAELRYQRTRGYKYLDIPRPKLVKLEYETEVSSFIQRRCKSKNRRLTVGKKTADKIVETLGLSAISKILQDKNCLKGIEGITEAKLNFIFEELSKSENYEELLTFLEINSLKTSLAGPIYQEFKEQSIVKIKENPYILYKILDDESISFKDIDRLGKSLGIGFTSVDRICAGILYYIDDRVKSNGDLYVVKEDIFENIYDFLLKRGCFTLGDVQGTKITLDLFDICFNENLLDQSIALELNSKGETCVYRRRYKFIENNIINSLKRLLRGKLGPYAPKSAVDKFIPEYEADTGFPLATNQKEAVYMAVEHAFSILTGGPGTGKTATTNAILKCIKAINPEARILLLAPTGKASKRMTESCGEPAMTIHRGLRLNPAFSKKATEEDLLNYDYIFIDESSMVDAILFSLLLERITDTTRLILVGDVDQLPSVGPGLILRDLIDSGKVPVTRLNELFRQAKDSQININSHKIIKGDSNLEIDQENKKDFFFWNSNTVDTCKTRVIDCYKRCLNKGYPMSDICILSPMREGELGTLELNKLIQARFNHSDIFYKVDGMNIFKVGDRVMQTTNNYTLEVFNGEIGDIEEIIVTNDNVSIKVNYGMESPKPGEPAVPKIVNYTKDEVKELVLAYCMTIHKSQGSEFSAVITLISDQHVRMLNRNLIYTAWTRAKKVVLNIGQRSALTESIKSMEHMSRNSRIIEKLNNSL